MGLKIREAEKQKIPYMLVVGDKEVANRSLALRKRKDGNLGVLGIEEVLVMFLKEINLEN